MKVFVYGTLQRGQGNHRLLADQMFLGEAVTVRHFAMVDVGFPFMLWDGEETAPVAGELFDIGDDLECLDRLDRLESEGRMYDRVRGSVVCDGKRHTASFYVACRGRMSNCQRVPLNDRGQLAWRKRS
jgi:gamma-glutamylaminecyclotransferase